MSKAISSIAKNIENNIKNEEQYSREKKQVVELLKQKDIEIQEISIQKEDRFLIEVYMQKSNNTDIEYIENKEVANNYAGQSSIGKAQELEAFLHDWY